MRFMILFLTGYHKFISIYYIIYLYITLSWCRVAGRDGPRLRPTSGTKYKQSRNEKQRK